MKRKRRGAGIGLEETRLRIGQTRGVVGGGGMRDQGVNSVYACAAPRGGGR